MNFITYNNLNNLIYNNLSKIPNDVDLIVGLPRSGMLIATMISLYLNLPLTDIDSLLNDKIYESGITKKNSKWIKKIEEARKILVVEDSSNTGTSIQKFKDQISNYKYKDKIILLTVFVTKETKKLTDMYFEICSMPRLFEWNYIHHIGVENACFDIDGVLCDDPTEEQNDDGEKYVDFIKNAKVKLKPTFTIECLVTNRLEKYRKETEEWLKKNDIKYNKLIMSPFENKEERIRNNSYGSFKAKLYKKMLKCNIFVESSKTQAIEIARISKKAVFCIENQTFYKPSNLEKSKEKIKKIIPIRIKKIIKKILKIN